MSTLALFLTAALSLQAASPEKDRAAPEETHRPRPRMVNRVFVEMHRYVEMPSEHPQSRQLYPLLVQEDHGPFRNEFQYDSYHYYPPPRKEAPPDPGFSLGFTVGAMSLSVGTDFIEGPVRTTTTTVVTVDGGDREDPPVPPGPTKSLSDFGDPGESETSDSARPRLHGPSLSLPVKADVTEWGFLDWLPAGTSLELQVRALFGTVDVLGVSSDAAFYSAAPRLFLPVFSLDRPALVGGVAVSAGACWLRTDVGRAAGVEGALGLHARCFVAGGLSVNLGVDVNAFASESVFAWGLLPTLGINVAW
ncbi:MAG TPA: hypothetical protein VNO22_17895 [Planctomycetota bacterium]|nr:hypothetical protein [Planctomycetota bacterium]